MDAVPEYNLYFFDWCSQEEEVIFHDAISVISSPLSDVFNMDDISLPEYSDNFNTHKDWTLVVSFTSQILSFIASAYIVSIMTTITLLYNRARDSISVILTMVLVWQSPSIKMTL